MATGRLLVHLGLLLLCYVTLSDGRGHRYQHFKFHYHSKNYFRKETFSDLIEDMVLLTVGGDSSGATDNVEIFDFKTNTSCYGVDYPYADLAAAEGAYVNHDAIVCGGETSSDIENNGHCFVFDPVKQKWYRIQDMRENRLGAAAVRLHRGHTWWMYGGNYNRSSGEVGEFFDDTEIYEVDNYWAEGPDVRRPVLGHCMVVINDNETAIIGGEYYNGPSDCIDIYNWATRTWRTGPSLPNVRSQHGCGALWPKDEKTPTIVIAGGYRTDIDLWDVKTDTITTITGLGANAGGIEVVEMEGRRIALVGGGTIDGLDSKVYLMTNSAHVEAGDMLEKRLYHTSFLIPRDYMKCRT